MVTRLEELPAEENAHRQIRLHELRQAKYGHHEHHIMLCDATTGHTARTIALCDEPLRAEVLAHAASCFLPLVEALDSILSLGRKDTSNPKYDGYYDAAREAIAKAVQGEQ